MAMTLERSTHSHWEDWLLVAVGLVIIISPAIVGGSESEFAVLNGFVIGLAVAAIAGLELSGVQRWEEWVQLLLGLWLMAAPWILGYNDLGSLTGLHVALGIVVVMLACAELWQDKDGVPPAHPLS